MLKNISKDIFFQYGLSDKEIPVYSTYLQLTNATISEVHFLLAEETDLELEDVKRITLKLEHIGFLRKIEGIVDRWACLEPYFGLFTQHIKDFVTEIQKIKDQILVDQSEQFDSLDKIRNKNIGDITETIQVLKDTIADFTLKTMNTIDDAREMAELNGQKLEDVYNASKSISKGSKITTWHNIGREALIGTMNDIISRVKSSIFITMPLFVPEVLQVIADFAYQKKAARFNVYSYWDDNVFGEIVEKMKILGNISFRKLDQPGEYYTVLRDSEEVVIAPVTNNNEELISLISVNQGYVNLVSHIMIPLLSAKSRLMGKREKKIESSTIEEIKKERLQEKMNSLAYFMPQKEETKEKGILAFVSYAIKDSSFFRIGELVESLKFHNKIDDVFYCEKDTKDNFVKYMNKYLGKCDLMILFCSPNALESSFVEEEWMAALAMKKPIIPVFTKVEHIPPLLKARVGVEFDNFNFQKNIDELHALILKQTYEKL